MASPLLETKFYAPRWRGGLVRRPRLIERLNGGTQSKLTLVSAPAGFGKTTLLAEWLAAALAGEYSNVSAGEGSAASMGERRVARADASGDHQPAAGGDGRCAAWLSLDQGDNRAAAFWTYVIAALQTVRPGIGASARALLQSPQPPPIETVLAPLLNELSRLPHDLVLVLDDFHVVDAHDARDGLVFLLDHLPPRLHLVIASRADPLLPLARLRARGELVEIRAVDLRFTPDEAAAYLNQIMGLHLTADDVAALEARTEGWIAALQLAALSMQARDDVAGFIASFAGDDRYIVDYLVEEVLQLQPARVRSFLMQTSILDRLSASLCNAVTGQDDGKAMLEALDRGNLFVVPLDDRRRWYRYHHLFGDVVHAHLVDEQPGAIPDLHRRASAWYERNGERSEAIRHALAGQDFSGAADLIQLALPDVRKARREGTFLAWLAALPDGLVASRPVLGAAYAWALMSTGQLDGVEARLEAAERSLRAQSPETIVADDPEVRRLPGMIAIYRAAYAQAFGNVSETVEHARRALELFPEDEHLGRGAAAGLLGLAFWATGDLEAAHRNYSECTARLRRSGHIADTMGCAVALADIRLTQGRLRDAMRTYEQAWQVAMGNGGLLLRGAADMHVGMSEVLRERDELEPAMQHLRTSQELGEHTGLPQNRYRWRVAMARLQAARGDLDGALALFEDAERVYTSDFFPRVRPIPAWKARVWVAQGKLDQALGWAREQGVSAEDDLSYLREFEHITLASVFLANRSVAGALALLARLLPAAEAGGRTESVIEILVLQALARQMQGGGQAALAALDRALGLAEPEGYRRIFIDMGAGVGESSAVADLLEAAAKQAIAPGYVRELLAVAGSGKPVPRQSLAEPLSERELEVLRLLGTDLKGPEIAGELMVSLNTVRTHTKNIFAKLGVNTRRAAVHRAAELALP